MIYLCYDKGTCNIQKDNEVSPKISIVDFKTA